MTSPRDMVARTGACVLGWALLLGCGERGVGEQRVPKGAEPMPAEQGGASSTAGTPGGDQGAGLPGPGAIAAMPWVVPAGWRRLEDAGPMRVATFVAEVSGRPVEIAVTQFPGDVGGVLANVNRWRGQMGLGPIDEAGLEGAVSRFGTDAWSGYAVRVRGPEQHMLAAGVHERSAGRTWFVRATGPEADLDALEPEFTAFSRSIGGQIAP
jgi:hypothetical protein